MIKKIIAFVMRFRRKQELPPHPFADYWIGRNDH